VRWESEAKQEEGDRPSAYDAACLLRGKNMTKEVYRAVRAIDPDRWPPEKEVQDFLRQIPVPETSPLLERTGQTVVNRADVLFSAMAMYRLIPEAEERGWQALPQFPRTQAMTRSFWHSDVDTLLVRLQSDECQVARGKKAQLLQLAFANR